MKKNMMFGMIIIVFLGGLFLEKKIKGRDVAIYLDDEYSNSFPKKGEAVFKEAKCDDKVNVSWNNETWELSISNLDKKVKCNLYFVKSIYNFDYTGTEEIFTAPVTGTYKLEVWGAQGQSNLLTTPVTTGGYGGYASGLVTLKADDTIYINVGQKGRSYIKSYNGGGFGQLSGGGATHIATKSGLLSSLENNKSNILIVAGGGGGNDTSRSIIPSGGGFIGVNGENTIAGSQKVCKIILIIMVLLVRVEIVFLILPLMTLEVVAAEVFMVALVALL